MGRPRVAALASAAGFAAACQALGLGNVRERHLLPRQDMGNRASVAGLWLKAHEKYEPLLRNRRIEGCAASASSPSDNAGAARLQRPTRSEPAHQRMEGSATKS